MPDTISVNNNAFADYLKVASLPRSEKITAFGKLSNEQKASFFKVQLALQFVKRPNMTREQKDFLLESISKVSADLYDKQDPQKVALANQINQETESRILALFPQKDAFEILEGLGTNKTEEISLVQKYEDLLKNPTRMRMKIAKEMLVNDRVNIWKVQLAYHLATGKFSKYQNEFILEMLTTLSPDTFSSHKNLSKQESAKELELLDKKIQSFFSKAEEFAIFEKIGIQETVSNAGEKNTVNTDYIFCDCRWYCGATESCGSRCNVEVPECGPFGDWYCSGKCG